MMPHATPPVTPRRGTTLVELVVALSLLTVILAIGALVAQRTLSEEARVTRSTAQRAALADALHTLTRHLSETDPAAGDLQAVRDTMLDALVPIGLTTTCRHRADTLTVATAAEPAPWAATLPRDITAGDVIRVWSERSAGWVQSTVAATATAAGPCGDSLAPWPDRASVRLLLRDTLPPISAGSPIRLLQRQKWSLIRSVGGEWALAMATWDPLRSAFTTPQPVVAPLASPTARSGPGFTVTALDSTHAPVGTGPLSRTRALHLSLRTPPNARSTSTTDSAHINVGYH